MRNRKQTSFLQRRGRRQRGGVLISILCFVVITGIIMAGIGRMTVSHYQMAGVEGDYAAALYLAEAGINYELRVLSNDNTQADQKTAANPNGTTVNFGGGSFTVYVANKDGTTPWTPGKYAYVVSTGTYRGVSRTLRVAVKGQPYSGKWAVFTVDQTSIWSGSSMHIYGDIGTNNLLSFSGTPYISGSVYFHGPSAGWYGGVGPTAYTVIAQKKPVKWKTVDEIALEKFPATATSPGGMAYIATNNNNATAIPPIVNNTITQATILKAGNYYVTSLNLTASKYITFDNSLGPINLWIGPSGGTAVANFNGGTALNPIVTGPDNACYVYVATKGGITLNGSKRLDAAIYAYNKDAAGVSYGYVSNGGNPDIYGVIVANKADLNGNVGIHVVDGLVAPSGYGYYGFDNEWVEVGGQN
jgi:Tfp pilus assembly protein PilX